MIFREMRDIGAPLTKEETEALFISQKHGTLGVIGDNGYPYTVPVNFVYEKDRIYFHSAICGHKYESLKKEPKVCFSVIGEDLVVPEKFHTFYSSVIAFGKARILTDDDEKRNALRKIIAKYCHGFEDAGEKYIDAAWNNVAAIEIKIEHITGKKGTE